MCVPGAKPCILPAFQTLWLYVSDPGFLCHFSRRPLDIRLVLVSAGAAGPASQPVQVSELITQLMRDTLENWQSEFLQLLWQVGGLAPLLHVGSPQPKEGDDRMEAKLDALLLAVDPDHGNRTIRDIDDACEGRPTDQVLQRRLAEKETGNSRQ